MARKLKTFVTSIGFYDLAVAAPSMKAAIEAWGSRQNLFHQGLASETQDPAVVEAAMAKPGVVLRRAVGTNRPYQEQADPPNSLPVRAPKPEPVRRKPAAPKPKAAADPKTQQAAILSFEKAKAKREEARRRQEAAQAKEQAATEREDAHRRKAVAKARAALDQARKHHDQKLRQLETDRQAAEDRISAEQDRWRQEEKHLERKVREANT